MKVSVRHPATMVALLALVAGCSEGSEGGVASIGEGHGFVDGYINQATADYAGCLKSIGLEASPTVDGDDRFAIPGYAVIEGGSFVSELEGGDSFDISMITVTVDGNDVDADVKSCYAKNPGAKDWVLDLADLDLVTVENQFAFEEGVIDGGRVWAKCAREAGVASINDPNPQGYVVIPDGVTLEEARMLGRECSAPLADSLSLEQWPAMQYEAGVWVEELQTWDLTPIAEAIDAPFLESDTAQRYREKNPEPVG